MKLNPRHLLPQLGMLIALTVPACASAEESGLNVNFSVDKTTQRIGPMTVKSVAPNSPASRAGVRVGDRVVNLDGFSVTNAPIKQLVPTFERLKGKKKYSITVVHDGQPQPVTVEIEKRS